MKRILSVILFLVLISTVQTVGAQEVSEEDMGVYGCEYRGNDIYCPQPTFVLEVTGTVVDDLWCFSTTENLSCSPDECAEYIDVGCFTLFELDEKMEVEMEWISVTPGYYDMKSEFDSHVIDTGEYEAIVDPNEIDFAGCDVISDESLVICPYNNTRLRFDGAILITDLGTDFLIIEILEEEETTGGITEFFSQNIIYIALIVLIIIVVIQVFKPKKKESTGKVGRAGKPKRKRTRKPI